MSAGGESSSPTVITSFWKAFWRLPVPRKIKLFGWRCFHDALPVGTNLFVRNVAVDFSCPVCNYKYESMTHVLLNCWWANAVWQKMGKQEWMNLGSFYSLADVLFYLCTSFDPRSAALGLVTMWYIWGARNRLKHDNVLPSPVEATSRITALANEFYRYHTDKSICHFLCSDFQWIPPPVGTIKINCDASWSDSTKSGSVGVIARDAAGHVLAVRARCQVCCQSVFDCEGWSLLEGLMLCHELGFKKAIIESDSAEAVTAINCRSTLACGNREWYTRCLAVLDRNVLWSVMLIRREANAQADYIANFARRMLWSCDVLLFSAQGHKEWINEVNLLGVVKHPNLVKLVGYCAEDDERGIQRLLVYELMENKSLEDHLLARGLSPLSWIVRLRIVRDAARGLAYLHEEMEFQLIFRDFKTSNILLDEHFNARLSDFGLARQGPAEGNNHVSTSVVGTIGYTAPEYVQTGRLTTKSDVWSFGVVLYELITGRRAVERNLPRGEQKLLEWVRPYISDSKKFHLIIDPRLEQLEQYTESAQKLSSLANKCLMKNPKSRPKMSEVVEALGDIISEIQPREEDAPQSANNIIEDVESKNASKNMKRVFNFREMASLRNKSTRKLDWRKWTTGITTKAI
ncbi:unnamed protein product [Rhodiola kirilowii]